MHWLTGTILEEVILQRIVSVILSSLKPIRHRNSYEVLYITAPALNLNINFG